MNVFKIVIIMAAKIAIPNPSITKADPINAAVNLNVIALMTNRNRPNVIIVTGSVKNTNIGRTIKFKIDRMILAKKAAPNPDI